MVYFYLAGVVGGWFSGETVLYLTGLVAFVWPRLYEEKQKEIDQLYAIASAQIVQYYNLAISKIPPNVAAKLPFLKPKSN